MRAVGAGALSAHEELLAALESGDRARFDDAVRALPSPSALLPLLLAQVSADERAAAERLLPDPTQRVSALDVPALAKLGVAGFWCATEWAFAAIPRRVRDAPAPAHERWDALVEIHKERLEAPWLVAELLRRLDDGQIGLARRAVLGIARRFGARGRELVIARVEGAPLADVIVTALGPPAV